MASSSIPTNSPVKLCWSWGVVLLWLSPLVSLQAQPGTVSGGVDLNPLQVSHASSISLDAVATLREPATGSVNFLFMEYVVDSEGITAVSAWLEPHYHTTWRAFYPVGAIIELGGDDDHITYLLQNQPTRLDEPEQRRNAGIGGGIYDPEDALLTDNEFRANLPNGPDLDMLYKMAQLQQGTCTSKIPIPRADSLARLFSVCYADRRISQMSFFDAQQAPLKEVQYHYGDEGGGPLTEMDVQLYPRKLTVPTTASASFNQKEATQLDAVHATYHHGGRSITVDFVPATYQDESYTVPQQIDVRNTATGEFLRKIVVTRSEVKPYFVGQTHHSPKLKGGLSDIENRLYPLLTSNYLKEPHEVSAEDKQEAGDLLTQLFEEPNLVPGPIFRRLYHSTLLAHMLGDAETATILFEQYLDEAVRLDSPRLLAYGGRSFLRLLLRWKKYSLYDQCLAMWRERVLSEVPLDVMAEFLRDSPRNGDSWFAVALFDQAWLDTVPSKNDTLVLLYFWSQCLYAHQNPIMPADHLERWGQQPPADLGAALDLDQLGADWLHRAQKLLEGIPETVESKAVHRIRQYYNSLDPS